MIEVQTEYILKHKAKDPCIVEVEIITEEDYNPDTDGYHCDLIAFSKPLSLPQDNSGTSDIDGIMHDLKESANDHMLYPGTCYRIIMVECLEEDGFPHFMKTWGVQEVCTSDLSNQTTQEAS